jgi:hypothetical protein
MMWQLLHPNVTMDHLGFIPTFLNDADKRPARKQFSERYVFGGWNPLPSLELMEDYSLKYPGDPPLLPIAIARLRRELILVYDHAFVAIVQPDRSFEACRID